MRTGRRLVFLAYPNNPTGNLFDARAIEAIVREAPGLVVVGRGLSRLRRRELHATGCGRFRQPAGDADAVEAAAWPGLRLGMLVGDAGVVWRSSTSCDCLTTSNVSAQAGRRVLRIGDKPVLDEQAAADTQRAQHGW
ncbi:MAG: hypothetical protein MZV65_29500 [Chromatiales bacterium]|nr:hypothetical protein [Chromatiales bacterium]